MITGESESKNVLSYLGQETEVGLHNFLLGWDPESLKKVFTSGFPVKICEKCLKNYSLSLSLFDEIFVTRDLWVSSQNPPTKGKADGEGSRGDKIVLKHEKFSVSLKSHTGSLTSSRLL